MVFAKVRRRAPGKGGRGEGKPSPIKGFCYTRPRVGGFKLLAIFALDAALGPQNHPKTLQISPPSPPKGTPEEPRSAQERPRRAPRASQNHPQRALRVPLGVQKVSWAGFGSLGASFWSPQGQFYLVFLTFPNVIFSLLSLFSHICYYVHPLFFSLFSSPFSLLASLFALLFGLSNGSLLLKCYAHPAGPSVPRVLVSVCWCLLASWVRRLCVLGPRR